MRKMNITVIDKNYLGIYGGNKQLVRPFRRQEFWKFIGFFLSEVTHGNKGRNIWVWDQIIVGKQALNKLHRDVPGNTDLMKVSCDIYSPHYCNACH